MSFSVEIKVSLPKKKQATKKWLDAIATAQRKETVSELKSLFKQTVYGWSEKPEFGWSQTKSSSEISIKMYPVGSGADKWLLVNAGSPAHRIPRNGSARMTFKPGYRSATRPGSLQSRRAYRSGKMVGARSISHPGFEARNFTVLIAEEYDNKFYIDMQAAISRVANS